MSDNPMTPHAALRWVQRWNHRYPVGQLVAYAPYSGCPEGELVRARTLSRAFLAADDEPVVLIEWRAGYVSLRHVRPLGAEVAHG